MGDFLEGKLISGGMRLADIDIVEWLNFGYYRALTDSPPEICEMVSQISEAETEEELERLLAQTRGLSMALGREADDYLRKKGVHRKVTGPGSFDPDAVEEDWTRFLEAAREAEAALASAEDPEPE